MTLVGTGERDSKDIMNYARSLTVCKRNRDIDRALKALEVIRDICERGIKEIEKGGKRAEDYFMETF